MSAFRPQSRKDQEADLERELRADLELEAEEQQQSGVSAEEAKYRAIRSLGNATLVKEDVLWAFWQRGCHVFIPVPRWLEAYRLDRGALSVPMSRSGEGPNCWGASA